MPSIVVLTLRALTGRRRLLVLGLLVVIPVILAAVAAATTSADDGAHIVVKLFDNLLLPVEIPLVSLIVAAGALGHEVEDRTLIYLTLRPIGRHTIVLAKYLAAVILVGALTEAMAVFTQIVAWQKAAGGAPAYDAANVLAALTLATLAACLAYVGLFLLLGLVTPQRGLLIGFVYILVWEGIAAGLSPALATFSIRRYAQGLLDTHLSTAALAEVAPSTLSAAGSAVGLAAVAVLSLVLTVVQLTRMQLP